MYLLCAWPGKKYISAQLGHHNNNKGNNVDGAACAIKWLGGDKILLARESSMPLHFRGDTCSYIYF